MGPDCLDDLKMWVREFAGRDEKKERLIEDIEARLKQRIEKTELFTIKWSVV